jgi:SAM-dependent methyltransferase
VTHHHDRWLSSAWPFVRDNLLGPPGRVLEIGCGQLGGFVPELHAAGYDAIGIDPEAPDEPAYRRVEFEHYEGPGGVDAIVASTSLHHVDDVGDVLDLAREMLAPGGVLVILEWASERFDETTAHWCFDRLPPADDEPEWLHVCQAEWQQSGKPWDTYCRGWADEERLHTGQEIVHELDARFERRQLEYGPYFFPGLDGVSEAEEQAAIDAGLVQAARIQYVGTLR